MLRFGMVLGVLLGALAPLPGAPARGQDAAASASPPRDGPFAAHHYDLRASLDPAAKRVHGTSRITFTNTSQRPLDALLFHLYLNAFRDRESVFMRESGGSLRGQRADGRGGITIESLVVAGHDALARAERELVPHDFTQLRVPLAQPLAPGERVVIETAFVAQLPPVFARSGYAGDFFSVGQWFPKLAKLERSGEFVSFPYHALGEFYADFADYALEVDAPRDYDVVASGALLDESPHGARIRRQFAAENVHDVAFVAARNFHVDIESVDGVLVRYLSPPGYDGALLQHAEVVRAGLKRFGQRFGHYPYPTLSVVLPPRDAPGASGMEYPGLIVSGGGWWPLPGLPSLGGAVITAHELAHQWFYGLLASDEVHHPVLDEGLTEWASLDLMRALYGAREGVAGLTLDRFEVERALAVRPAGVAPGRPAYTYGSHEYATSVYSRAAAVLESIRRSLGDPRFERALALYTARHRFGHPTPQDLERAFEEVYGTGFAAQVLRPLLFDGDGSSVRITSVRSRQEDDDGYLTEVRAERSGVPLPTWLALFGRDGKTLAREPFRASQSSLFAALRTREPVARAVLDPDRALLLDANVSDQIVELRERAGPSLWSQLLAASQLLMGWWGP